MGQQGEYGNQTLAPFESFTEWLGGRLQNDIRWFDSNMILFQVSGPVGKDTGL